MRAADHDLAEEPPVARQRRRMVQDRPPARLRVEAVDREPRAAEVGERVARRSSARTTTRCGTIPADIPAPHSRAPRAASPCRRARAPTAARRSARAPAADAVQPSTSPRSRSSASGAATPAARSASRIAAQSRSVASAISASRTSAAPRGRRHCRAAARHRMRATRRPAPAGSRSDARPDPCAAAGGAEAPRHRSGRHSRRCAAATPRAGARIPPAADTREAVGSRGARHGSCC